VHVIVHTYAHRRTPRCATVELAVVAKPPTCLRAQVRTWTPPLADQCSHTRGPRPRLSVARPRVNSNPRRRPSHRRQESPILDSDLLFARRRPRRVVRCLCQPSLRRAALFLCRRYAHARPLKRAAMPPRTPQSRRRRVQAAPSRLPSHRHARPGASPHGRTLVHALDQAIAFALLARVRWTHSCM
jgi:hypothetical protein